MTAPATRVPVFARSDAGKLVSRALIGYFRATLENAALIPSDGPALLVSNHAAFGLDSFVLAALVLRDAGRYPRFLVERELARLLPIRLFFSLVEVLPGNRETAVEALGRGELVGVYPGGIDESLKLSRDRHRLKWGARTGFAEVAVRSGAPVVPIAGIGVDDMYSVVAREPWVGRRLLGSPRYDLPIAFGAYGTPLPRRTTIRFVVCPPLRAAGGGEDAIRELRSLTYAAIDAHLAAAR